MSISSSRMTPRLYYVAIVSDSAEGTLIDHDRSITNWILFTTFIFNELTAVSVTSCFATLNFLHKVSLTIFSPAVIPTLCFLDSPSWLDLIHMRIYQVAHLTHAFKVATSWYASAFRYPSCTFPIFLLVGFPFIIRPGFSPPFIRCIWRLSVLFLFSVSLSLHLHTILPV